MTASGTPHAISDRDRQVRRVILLEGAANLAVLIGKLVVGLATGSLAVLGDAVHSLTDLANNFIAWFVIRLSNEPPDREHPYGHRKFEMMAVFGLATLLAVLAVELALQAIRRETPEISDEPWAIAVMVVVLVVNASVATWQRGWARRLDSDILLADASHTLADVLVTTVVILGWQFSARGYPWLDTACALGVAAVVMYLAFGLFRRALPALADRYAIDPEVLVRAARSVPGVRTVGSVRSRWLGSRPAIDMVVSVDPLLSTLEAHAIADRIEALFRARFRADDVSIHIEPDEPSAGPAERD